MHKFKTITQRGVLLDGALFRSEARAETVVICITGIHGNFLSNPFYYTIGSALNSGGIDFMYAQTNDAYSQIKTINYYTRQMEIIGSWNERFSYVDEDIESYLDFAEKCGYKRVILAGHSLGANKVINYLSHVHDERIEKFILLSPANLTHMTSEVTSREKDFIRAEIAEGRGDILLPFYFMGWVPCIANTASDWLSPTLNNVHVERDGDFSQASSITHSGALLIGTLDRFTYGDPTGFLANLNDHLPTRDENQLVFIQGTGHTYQQKEHEVASSLLSTLKDWGY